MESFECRNSSHVAFSLFIDTCFAHKLLIHTEPCALRCALSRAFLATQFVIKNLQSPNVFFFISHTLCVVLDFITKSDVIAKGVGSENSKMY